VAKGVDANAVESAAREITILLRAVGGRPVQGEPPV
jgi:hypothetical protein